MLSVKVINCLAERRASRILDGTGHFTNFREFCQEREKNSVAAAGGGAALGESAIVAKTALCRP